MVLDDDLPGVAAAAAEDVGPQLLKDVPEATIDRTDELLQALTGPAVRAVLLIRAEQIAKHGHDREYDSMLPLVHLPKRAKWFASASIEHITGTGQVRDLRMARVRLAKAAALCLAAIDRLDAAESPHVR
jgi:hypothetical protein